MVAFSSEDAGRGSKTSLYETWIALLNKDGRAFWDSTDLGVLQPWSGWLSIVDFDDPASDEGCFTSVGHEVVKRLGVDVTGKSFAEITPIAPVQKVLDIYARARRTGRPILSNGAYVLRDGAVRVERLVLPFHRTRQALADRLLVCTSFHQDRAVAGAWLGEICDVVCGDETVLSSGIGWEGERPTLVQLRNVMTSRGRTSLKLEPAYWRAVEAIARARRMTLNDLVDELDRTRVRTPLTRAVRLYILYWYRERAGL